MLLRLIKSALWKVTFLKYPKFAVNVFLKNVFIKFQIFTVIEFSSSSLSISRRDDEPKTCCLIWIARHIWLNLKQTHSQTHTYNVGCCCVGKKSTRRKFPIFSFVGGTTNFVRMQMMQFFIECLRDWFLFRNFNMINFCMLLLMAPTIHHSLSSKTADIAKIYKKRLTFFPSDYWPLIEFIQIKTTITKGQLQPPPSAGPFWSITWTSTIDVIELNQSVWFAVMRNHKIWHIFIPQTMTVIPKRY